MKSYCAIAVLPIVAGAVAACSGAQPGSGNPPDIEEAPTAAGIGGPQPSFGPVIQQPSPPPPISGGTLTMARDKKTAIAADADRDRVYIVDLPSRSLVHTVELPKHSEPGRVSVDDEGHAFVILRRAGGLATIDIATGAVTIRDVCIAPRGLAWDKGQLANQVACANGELVTVPRGAGAVKRIPLERDLRDVLVNNDGSLNVTTFRSASTVRVGKESSPLATPPGDGSTLAWRAVSVPSQDQCFGVGGECEDETAMVVQQPTPEPVKTDPGGYGGGGGVSDCTPPGIITTQVKVGGHAANLPEAVLPVDMATNGNELAVVAAGNAFTNALPQIFVVYANDVRTSFDNCVPTVHGNVPGQAVAAAFDGDDELIVQTREPAALHIMSEDRRRPVKTITLANDSVADTGHAIFHSNAGGFIACASCHAEGGDDGHVWSFVNIGPRRTPSLLGTIAGTEPFHWDGDMKDMRDLVNHVFVERMSGPKVDDTQLSTLTGWLYALPEPPKLGVESDATARGATLFQQRCTACHSGGRLTNNKSVDVGTGGIFQVPSLVGVGWRTSFLHTGCAKTLTERFLPDCGGSQHGDTQDLSSSQVSDLVKFLETL